ncbi:MAG: hypothetical protein Q4G48_07210 [Bacteroidia bacterium]|nr:hypothetical protein [Bacteroidia bacterium]
MKKLALIFVWIFLVISQKSVSCTTAVISGKATPDGRSMIWKLRDTDDTENSFRYFNDGKYTYIGLVNSKDTEGINVWGGSNSAGFAIMNSASYNVNVGDTTLLKDREGVFMKLALQTCASLQDLEKLLDTYPKPRGLAAHFGVIDAGGGAAFYEVNNQTWTKFDANTHANGYVIRTNYSESGTAGMGYGFIRRQTAEKIFAEAKQQNRLNYQTIVQQFTRCFYHPVFGLDYRQKYESGNFDTEFVASDDFLTRHSSASSIIVQSAKKDESPDMSTIWAQVGFPETCVAIPLWVRGGENLPLLVQYDEAIKNSPLNQYAMKWKNNAYPIGRSDGYHYLKMPELINKNQTGYVQRIEQMEKDIFSLTEEKLKMWRKETPDILAISEFYDTLNKKAENFYKE